MYHDQMVTTDTTQALLMAALDEPEEKSRRLVLADGLEESGHNQAGYLRLPGSWRVQYGGKVLWVPDRRPDPRARMMPFGLVSPAWYGFYCVQPTDPVGLHCEQITRMRLRGHWLCQPCAIRLVLRLIRESRRD